MEWALNAFRLGMKKHDRRIVALRACSSLDGQWNISECKKKFNDSMSDISLHYKIVYSMMEKTNALLNK